MKLWIGRHAYAGPALKDPKKERERPLLPEGVTMAKAIANAMGEADEIPKSIFASPYVRAQMTADIYGRVLGIHVDIIDDVAPIRPLYQALQDLLQAPTKLKRVMLVGHVDNTTPLMNDALSGDAKWTDMVMCEVRRVRISRDTLDWTQKWRIRPSDLGLKDYDQ